MRIHLTPLAAIVLLASACNTFGDLESEHPYTPEEEVIDLGSGANEGEGNAEPDAGQERDPSIEPQNNAADCPEGKIRKPNGDCVLPDGNDGTDPDQDFVDLSRFALAIGAAEGCEQTDEKPGPDLASVVMLGPDGAEMAGPAQAVGGASGDQIAEIFRDFVPDGECPAAVSIGCDGGFAVPLAGRVDPGATLAFHVVELGPDCGYNDGDPYFVAVCDIESSLPNQECRGVYLDHDARGRREFFVSVQELLGAL